MARKFSVVSSALKALRLFFFSRQVSLNVQDFSPDISFSNLPLNGANDCPTAFASYIGYLHSCDPSGCSKQVWSEQFKLSSCCVTLPLCMISVEHANSPPERRLPHRPVSPCIWPDYVVRGYHLHSRTTAKSCCLSKLLRYSVASRYSPFGSLLVLYERYDGQLSGLHGLLATSISLKERPI
jgi:hypothetical protein